MNIFASHRDSAGEFRHACLSCVGIIISVSITLVEIILDYGHACRACVLLQIPHSIIVLHCCIFLVFIQVNTFKFCWQHDKMGSSTLYVDNDRAFKTHDGYVTAIFPVWLQACDGNALCQQYS